MFQQGGNFMKLFQKNTVTLSPRQVLENQCKIGVMNLLVAIAFTLINIIMALTGSDSYFLFSAIIPYYLVVSAMFLCGKMPVEYYEGDLSEYIFLDNSYFTVCFVIYIVIIAVLALCWLFSFKQKVG